MDYSLPVSSAHGILQAGTPELASHFLLQGVFPTQGSNPALPHCRQIVYHLSSQWEVDEMWIFLSFFFFLIFDFFFSSWTWKWFAESRNYSGLSDFTMFCQDTCLDTKHMGKKKKKDGKHLFELQSSQDRKLTFCLRLFGLGFFFLLGSLTHWKKCCFQIIIWTSSFYIWGNLLHSEKLFHFSPLCFLLNIFHGAYIISLKKWSLLEPCVITVLFFSSRDAYKVTAHRKSVFPPCC